MFWSVLANIGLSDGIGFDDVVWWAAGIATIVGTIALILRPIRKEVSWMSKFRQDWEGSPSRSGYDAVPGMMERMQRIDGEMTHNHGSSMKDVVSRNQQDLTDIKEELRRLSRELEQNSLVHGRIFETLVVLDDRTKHVRIYREDPPKAK